MVAFGVNLALKLPTNGLNFPLLMSNCSYSIYKMKKALTFSLNSITQKRVSVNINKSCKNTQKLFIWASFTLVIFYLTKFDVLGMNVQLAIEVSYQGLKHHPKPKLFASR